MITTFSESFCEVADPAFFIGIFLIGMPFIFEGIIGLFTRHS